MKLRDLFSGSSRVLVGDLCGVTPSTRLLGALPRVMNERMPRMETNGAADADGSYTRARNRLLLVGE